MQGTDKGSSTPISIDPSGLPPRVLPIEIVMALGLRRLAEIQPDIIAGNPGFLVMANAIGMRIDGIVRDDYTMAQYVPIDHPLHQIIAATYASFDQDTAVRVNAAIRYVANTGGLNLGGHATILLTNGTAVIGTPEQLDDRQRVIFGKSDANALIHSDGLVAFIKACVDTPISGLEGPQRTLAHHLLGNVASFAGIDNRLWSVLIAIAIDGKLDVATLCATVMSLRAENANDHMAPFAREAIERHVPLTLLGDPAKDTRAQA